ncbi:recombinase family protein [Ligilactobacillus salivarius]|uniref:recombinase family protein n=1 Tax=Ligilactobacillus salivarius TaxID=1624 RepID=UPI0013712620|nr:recombinase [Ligilactobacillus salivarius]MYZ03628.1 recombinase [Ligilactobacillus salivarius]MYZ72429.1 recombinase [Ligilactobacillus salivarius]MYZ78121.1 recombinase [Ligilactobacillus salivarius]
MSKLKYGYQWQQGQIVINPDQAEVIKQIFAGFLAGQTRNHLARQFNLTHTSVLRILTANKYVGGDGYPQIITTTNFKQVQKQLKKQIVRKPKKQPTPPTKFYRGIINRYSDDAFKQAEHIYQLIYSEVEVYGES